ncbi:serine hydrolase domain-containing protein [Egicoccus halophilus]|uniref:Beta-lactamase-related domain-containing protein n=1 Tax=Egicoccus halophilus TaxID=1670830 RepID=A0A8J3ERJ4_9ACTN|nr:serine hydrolase domain-containing protein [Egicoccus halophilus]GGI05050.1 hypothetical protein GCM10011354_12160 [Egicoccus halophilus]
MPNRTWLRIAAGGLLGLLVGLVLAPSRPVLDAAGATGDARLVEEVLALVGDAPHAGLVAAVVEADGTLHTAGLGTADGERPVDADTPFEAGSVTKAMVGMLLADLVGSDAALDARTPLGQVLPGLAERPAGAITLEELAQHRSGLPVMAPAGPTGFLRVLGSTWLGTDPYGWASGDDLVAAAATSDASGGADPTYSNFGFGLLGTALATSADTELDLLLDERLWTPLGMDDTVRVETDGPLPAGHAHPHRGGDTRVSTWHGEGYLGAGAGIWSTARDLTRLAVSTRDGSAPGAEAAAPRADFGGTSRIGWGWLTTRQDALEVTWHDGGTGGMRSFVGFTDERVAVVLARGDRSVDHVGTGLLGAGAEPPTPVPATQYPLLAVTIGLPLAAAVTLLVVARRRRDAAPGPGPDRLRLVTATMGGATLLVLIWRAGLWGVVPPPWWAVGVGGFGAGLVAAGLRWTTLPRVASGRPALRWAGVAWSAAFLIASVVLVSATLGG